MEKRFERMANTNEILKWYEEYPKTEEPHKNAKSDTEISELKAKAKRYLDSETSVFQMKQSKSSDSETAWLKTALSQGTISDKIAAAIVLVQDNPKYNISRLTMLVNQVRVAKHNQCNMIITSLKDLFLSDLLHPEFKLLKFEEQNLDNLIKSNTEDTINKSDISINKLLAHWYFEDQLHEHYERFVTSLGSIASDTVDANREIAISVMTDLLIGNAEQEHKLLQFIVNKIGDPSNKVGSKVIFCLKKLLYEHPNMKLVVLREVEKVLFRKNVAQRAQYYAICLLTQFLLGKDDEKIASTLIEVYFAFFKACLKKGEPDSRMMAAILTGVNRAFPFAKLDSNVLSDHIDSVYKVVHIGSFNVFLNALNLLYQITGKDENQSNRFYSAFYRKILDPQIGVASKRALFLNLLFRVLQNDHNIQRVYAFIKRTLQVALDYPSNMLCAILYIISKVLHTKKELKNLVLHAEITIKTEIKSSASSSENISVLDKPAGDPKDPLYTGTIKDFHTELISLSKHYHPSVALFANTILQGEPIVYTGDPLEDLSLMRFLDRYVFKNPKKLDNKKVQRKNDPLAQRAGYLPKGIRCIPVDSASYLNEREEHIPVDELYLYRYLRKRTEFKGTSKVDDDLESVNSEEFNDMLDRLTEGKNVEDLDIEADIQTGKMKERDVEDEEDLENNSVESEAGSDLDDMNSVDEDLEELDNTNDDLEEFDGSNDDLEDASDINLDLEDDDASVLDFDEGINDNEKISNDDIELNSGKQISKGHKKKNKKNSKGMDSNIFVSAEKFAEMLEEHSKQRSKYGNTDMFNTADGAGSKQIEWEMKRHHKVKGFFSQKKRKGSAIFRKNVKRNKH